MLAVEDIRRLEQAKLFANISLESIEHLFARCRPIHIAAGEHLLEAGQTNGDLYLILEGELRVYLADRHLPEHAVLEAGDCVGEMSLIDGETASALVLAAVDSRVLAMPHDVLWSLVDCSHGVARNLLSILAGRMRNDNLALVSSQTLSLEFEQAATVDALTGIHNRRWLLESFPRAIHRCVRDHQPVCLLMADIDHFKRFNDHYGHLTGDAVLRRVARQLADGMRAQDLVARYGGEEFLLLLPHTGLDEALLIAERLRGLIASGGAADIVPGVRGITISCGVAQWQKGEELDDLIHRADIALHRAKDNGRDRVETAE